MKSIPDGGAPAAWRADPDALGYDETRRVLLDAGHRCLEQTGPRALRMHTVAREAACCRATLYRYFARKEDLLRALAVDRASTIFETAMDNTRQWDDPRDRIAEALVAALEIVETLPGRMDTLTGDPAIRRAVAGFISPLLDDARSNGILRGGVTAEDAAQWLLLVTVGLTNVGWAAHGPSKQSRESKILFLRRFVSGSLFTDPGAR